MELYINGEKAHKGMLVKTFRGESATLVNWSEPGTRSGGKGGRVNIELEGGFRREFFPTAVNGKFQDQTRIID